MDVDIQKIPSPKLPAKYDLHGPRDALSVTEDFVKVLGAQNVPAGGRFAPQFARTG